MTDPVDQYEFEKQLKERLGKKFPKYSRKWIVAGDSKDAEQT